MQQKFRIIVLGAGFSRPAGFPLATELWQEILQLAPQLEGPASKFNDDLNNYIDYRRESDGLEIKREDINFEDFMRYLDVEQFLNLRGSDTWSNEGNEGTVVTKTLIGAILADRSIKLQKVPELYLEFARRLQPHDIVITFNYDTLLERALDEVGKPYRLFPQRFNSVGEYGATVGDDRDEVVILKVHGSIDWFDRRGFEERKLAHKQQGAPPPSDIIFSHADELRLQPVVDGPRFDADPLRTVYRVGNLAALYNKTIMFLATPRMLPPSTAKMVYANQIGDFWDGMKAGGALNFGMTIIGFSMPAQDEYARQIMYSLATNYQGLHWDETVFGKKKTPLVLVKRSLSSSSIWPRPLPRQHLDLAVDHLEIALIGAPFVASDGTIIALGKHDASKEMPFSVSNSGMATLSFSTSSSNVSAPTASPGTSSLSAIQTLLSASQIAFTTTGPTIRTISLHFEEYS